MLKVRPDLSARLRCRGGVFCQRCALLCKLASVAANLSVMEVRPKCVRFVFPVFVFTNFYEES